MGYFWRWGTSDMEHISLIGHICNGKHFIWSISGDGAHLVMGHFWALLRPIPAAQRMPPQLIPTTSPPTPARRTQIIA